MSRIEFLRTRLRLRQAAARALPPLGHRPAAGRYGLVLRVPAPGSDEIVSDRLLLTMLVTFVTIIFTWIVAFPIGIYSATHQYSWGDYGLTFIGLIGLADAAFPAGAGLHVLRQCLVRHLDRRPDRPAISQPADELGQASARCSRTSWIPVIIIGAAGTAGMIRRDARQPARRAEQAVCRHRPRQGPAAGQALRQIPAAHVAQPLRLRYRQHPALDRLGLGGGRRRCSRCPRPGRSC